MGLKDLYQRAEDAYYSFADRVHATGVVSAIDKIVPSFPLLIVLLAGILLWGAFTLNLIPQNTQVTFTVADASGTPLEGVQVQVAFSGKNVSATSNADGKAVVKNVPVSSTLNVRVEREGFEVFEESFNVSSPNALYSIQLESVIPESFERTIQLIGKNSQSLDGVNVSVQFSCQNAGVSPNPTTTQTSNGIVKVSVPATCGVLLANANALGFASKEGIPLSGSTNTIELTALQIPKGTLKVKALDEEGNALEGMEISVFSTTGGKVKTKASNVYGQATFDSLDVGEYYASVSDPAQDYAEISSDAVEVEADTITNVELTLSKSVKGVLSVNVKDKVSGNAIANATVKLVQISDNKEVSQKTTSSGGEGVSFAVQEPGPYKIVVVHAEYLSQSKDAGMVSANASFDFELEKISSQNSGKALVKVADEDELPVENAKIVFFDSKTGFIVYEIPEKFTDANGTAVFNGIQDGSYYVQAYKFPSSPGKSVTVETKKAEQAFFNVSLQIGESSVKVKVTDKDNAPIPFAKVEFLTENSPECPANACMIPADNAGNADKTFKADRKVFARVSAEGYSSLLTPSRQLYPSQTFTLNAVLEKPFTGNAPEIIFIGLFDLKDKPLGELKAGSSAKALYRVRIPEGISFNPLGVHVRTGTQSLVENDSVYVNALNAPWAGIQKGGTYNPPTGSVQDLGNITLGDAKWAEALYTQTPAQTLMIEQEIKVRSEAALGAKIPLYYRAWGVLSNGEWARTPLDAQLGIAESTSSKHALYAETLEKVFFSGQAETCEETFCYAGENVFDQTQQLLLNDSPYPVSVSGSYTVSFSFTNNSPTIFSNAQLRVKSSASGPIQDESLAFKSYSIKNADGQPVEGNNLNAYEIPETPGTGIPLGNLSPFKTVQATFEVEPKKVGAAGLHVEVINNGVIVFEKTIPFSVASKNELSLSVNPSTVGALIPTPLELSVKDQEGFEVGNALASMTKITTDKVTTLLEEKYTNSSGKASFTAPASTPGTKLVLDAQKEGFTAIPFEIVVDSNVVSFDPKALNFTLNNTSASEDFVTLKISNKLETDLTLTDIQILGLFQGKLALTGMQNYVNQYKNVLFIAKGETQLIQVKAATASGAPFIDEETLAGTLSFSFKSSAFNQTWVQTLPMHVSIGLADQCDEGGIELAGAGTNGKWESSTFDNKAVDQFSLSNTCEVAGKEVALQNLTAELEWKGDAIGQVELTLTDLESGVSTTQVLLHNQEVLLFDQAKPVSDGAYEAVITFTPLTGNLGKTAAFEVTLSAELPGKPGEAKKSFDSFDASILITNLEQCVKFTPSQEKPLELSIEQGEAEFTVDTSECGDIPISFEFCGEAGNGNCSGGAPEGKLFLDQWTLNNVKKESKKVKVSREGSTLPGVYGITVRAKAPGTSFHQIALIKTMVPPDPKKYAFSWDRYEFTLYKKDDSDSTTVTNALFTEAVEVTASVCDWGEAMAEDDTLENAAIGTAAGVAVGGIASLLAGKGAFIALTTTTSWCPACWLIGLGVGIIVYFLLGDSEDPCLETYTRTLPDYIINLAGGQKKESLPVDAISVGLSNNVKNHVGGKWNTDVANISVNQGAAAEGTQNNALQFVGLVFNKKTDYADPTPLYGVVTLTAKEHIHGDPTHSGQAQATCEGSDFGPYNIGESCGEEITTRNEKFHAMFKTQEPAQSIPPTSFDTIACASGALLGKAGEGALPRVAFNWSWKEESGIQWNSCDAKNPDAIYCDATQFNIMLMKRLQLFNEFLAANDHAFSCPSSAASGAGSGSTSFSVAPDTLGMQEISYQFTGPSAVTFNAVIQNNTPSTQSVALNASLSAQTSGASVPGPCTKEGSVDANTSTTLSCTFSGLSVPAAYDIGLSLDSDTTSAVNTGATHIIFSNQSVEDNSGNSTCKSPLTTAFYAGAYGINQWIDPTDPVFGSKVTDTSIAWPPGVPNVKALDDLLHFDARLIHDGYSVDFENDFREYYTKVAFADTPTWYYNLAGTEMFSSYYGPDQNLLFTQKYVNSPTLPAAGKYRVDLEIYFNDTWNLFTAGKGVNALISVVFYHIDDAVPNSPFYNLPLNGNVGLKGSTLERIGYGVGFSNEDNEIKLDDTLAKTWTSTNSTPLVNVQTEVVSDLRKLNSIPSTRGNLLEVSADAGANNEKKLVFSPSLATPVMARVSHDITKDPFSAFYYALEGGIPVETGSTFTYWDGAGVCNNFDGVPITQAFNQTPDREATPNDQINNYEYLYGVDWQQATKKGNAYLRTVIYSPPTSSASLQGESAYLHFLTPDSANYAQLVSLQGISTMTYNSFSTQVDSLQDVFDLVANKQVCISDSGVHVRFFWNPQTIYKQTAKTSIHAETEALEAGKSCI
ncbi:MAG: carboxypeptidase regulatory-like domain-containing protein [Candidatus Diapherotrites archaeon]|nr:carboxypeptidase regulatory-like domain-containing protein [Candidatus Diapherotrites archaeon]